MPLRVIPADKLDAFGAAVRDQNWPTRIGLQIMLYCGLRVGEICKLCWDDLLTGARPKAALTVPRYAAKRHAERTIPIPRPLADEILTPIEYHYRPQNLSPANYLTAHTHGGKGYSTRHFQRVCENIGAQIGLDYLTPHTLRHTYADRLRRVTDLTVVQQALGHKRLSTTAIYAHPTLDELTAATTKLYPGVTA